ncbi:aminotransferase class I/II-fold pyridoxal phosphate-dependent enzyme [Nevskia sp.]|uniref:trans-sulfuration enzyme family protein n=1 Tax=Nevskia sp. TaxID=1929292 RepID=UPI0025FE3CBC|nr:aminotransferase class I/II-fold pyridoxal phosphate-dependent enzyme [Nevskia sp.]
MKLETLAIHAGRAPDTATGAVAPSPILSTTFARDAHGEYPHGHIYTRSSNPGRAALETLLAALEKGAAAAAFGSGSAASLAVFQALSPGDHVIAPDDVYHGTRTQLRELLARWGLSHSLVDLTDLDAVRAAVTPATKLIWAETPSNPLLKVSDIAGLSDIAHAAGAALAVDSTFATPVIQQPLALGADLVMHSTTKYLGGHSDVLGGAVIARDADSELFARVRDTQTKGGSVPSPFDCWLLQRSIATLPLRVRAQTANAQAIAEFLAAHRQVEVVHYPGLASHAGHTLASRQMRGGYGAMLSFQVRGGREAALAVAGRVEIFTRATSLGGVESLIEHRASVEGPHTTTPQNLLRMSVGLEHADDLIADLGQALAG